MVTARRSVTAEELGNAAAPLLVAVPTGRRPGPSGCGTSPGPCGRPGPPRRSPDAGVLGPLFRLLAVAGLYHWFYLGHQHRFHTLVSNVPGPDRPLSFAGAQIRAIVPVSVGSPAT